MTQTGGTPAVGAAAPARYWFTTSNLPSEPDFASPALMLHCANGKHIPEAHLTVRKAGGQPLEYLKIKLTDVLVSSYKPHAEVGGANGHSELPVDQFSLNFAKIEFAYQLQGPDGKAQGGPTIAGWDVKANQKA